MNASKIYDTLHEAAKASKGAFVHMSKETRSRVIKQCLEKIAKAAKIAKRAGDFGRDRMKELERGWKKIFGTD